MPWLVITNFYERGYCGDPGRDDTDWDIIHTDEELAKHLFEHRGEGYTVNLFKVDTDNEDGVGIPEEVQKTVERLKAELADKERVDAEEAAKKKAEKKRRTDELAYQKALRTVERFEETITTK